jgi:MFS family permease
MAFFFFGLLAIAICHLYLMRRSMPREEARLTSVWRWVPIMLGVVGGMVLVGFGVASIFSPELFESIGRGFSAVSAFFGKIFGYILIPIAFVFEWLIKIFIYLVSLLRSEQAPPPDQTGNATNPVWTEVISKDLPPWVTDAIRWFVIALLIGLVLFILVKAVSRMRARRARDEIEEIHESLWSWKGLRDDLKGLLKTVFKRKEELVKESRFNKNVKGEMDIREIYRHLQWEGGRSGIPRRRYETASEYANHLERELPDSTIPLDDITRMYENVRYGENIVPEEQVHHANGLWQTIKGMLRKQRGE